MPRNPASTVCYDGRALPRAFSAQARSRRRTTTRPRARRPMMPPKIAGSGTMVMLPSLSRLEVSQKPPSNVVLEKVIIRSLFPASLAARAQSGVTGNTNGGVMQGQAFAAGDAQIPSVERNGRRGPVVFHHHLLGELAYTSRIGMVNPDGAVEDAIQNQACHLFLGKAVPASFAPAGETCTGRRFLVRVIGTVRKCMSSITVQRACSCQP